MSTRWNKRNFDLKIEEMVKENTPVFAGDMNLDRTGKGMDVQDIKVEGVTFANKLGTSGEIDANWTAYATTISIINDAGAISGNALQMNYLTSASLLCKNSLVPTTTDDYVFFSAYYKSLSGTLPSRFFCYSDYSGSWSATDMESQAVTTSWKKYIGIAKATGTSSANKIAFVFDGCSSDSITYVSNVNVINLTEMNFLPKALQQKYGQTKWEDLTKEECNEIFENYVGSFSNPEEKTSIRNVKKNIWVKSLENVKIAASSAKFSVIGDELQWKQDASGTRKLINSLILEPLTDYVISAFGRGGTSYLWVNGSIPTVIDGLANSANIKGRRYGGKVTTDNTGDIDIYLYEGDSNILYLKEFSIVKSSTDVTYVVAGKEAITFDMLNGINDELDDLSYKRTETETVTITTNTGTTASSGTGDCVLESAAGLIYRGTMSGTTITVTAANGDYTIFYVLTTPVAQDSNINLLSEHLNGEHNNFVAESYDISEFSGDGSTTAFTLSPVSTTTTYDVFVAGILQSSGVTKTTTTITFDSAPKNGAIIRAKYNLTTNSAWFATLNVYEPSGTQVSYGAQTAVTIQENQKAIERTDKFNNTDRKIQSRDYTIQLDMDTLKDAQAFIDKWKGKKFRMIMEYTNGTSYEKDIAAICEIESSSKDWLTPSESVTIRATDYYFNQ